MAAKNKANELYLTRVYDAPVKLVWEVWTDPKHVAKWWGPRGFTLTTHSKDLRVGGHWKYTMHGPDGVDYENRTIYHEVEPYKKLVYDHGGSEDRPPLFRVTVTFEELKGKRTKMEMTMALPTPEAAVEARKFIKKAGGDSTWDRLAEYLAHETEGKDPFVINRSFAAPVAKLFEMWADPTHVTHWLPPIGFTMKYKKADIRPGGESFFSMTNGEITMYGRMKYLEVSAPNRIVYTQVFCDENGNQAKHPMAPTWPAVMMTTVEFSEEDEKRSRVTVRTEVYGDSTSEERETFRNGRSSMTMGWTGSFDKLETLLTPAT